MIKYLLKNFDNYFDAQKNNISSQLNKDKDQQIQIILEEYKALREEVLLRLTHQQKIIGYSLTLIVGLFTVTQLIPLIVTNLLPSTLRIILLFGSIIFSSFALMYLDEDINMAFIGNYFLSTIKPNLEELCGITNQQDPKFLSWEMFHSKRVYSLSSVLAMTFLEASRFSLNILPAICLLVYYFYIGYSISQKSLYEVILSTVSIFIVIIVFYTMALNIHNFHRWGISGSHSK